MKDPKTDILLFQKLKQTCIWFNEFCSWSGISQYRVSDNKISKAFWLVLYIAGLCLTLLLVRSSFKRLLAHPFTTKVGRTNKFVANFPSVTICNPNRIHCEHLLDLIEACSKVNIILPPCFKGDIFHDSICSLFLSRKHLVF